MKQKISLFYVAIAFSIAGLCTSCSSDDPVDDTGGGTNNPGGTSSDVKQLDYGELLAFPYAEGHGRNTCLLYTFSEPTRHLRISFAVFCL